MSFPPPPVTTLNWENLGFVSQQFNGHIECRYNVTDGSWSEPELVLDPFLRIHGLSPALNYGQQAYEGLKAFRDPNGQIYIFRPELHAERLNHSAMYVSIPSIPKTLFSKAVHLAVSHNAEYVPPHDSNASLYIRPLVFGSAANLPLSPPPEYLFCVYVQPLNAYHGTNAADALIMDDFDRAAPEGTGSAKVGGNYAPVIRWSEKAKKEGYGITLHLDSKTRSKIDEFSTSGFIGVLQGENEVPWKLVVPDSKSAIKSITSDSCLELAKKFGWQVEIRQVGHIIHRTQYDGRLISV
ncbi:hypothetical protein ACEPPN_012225 [Leptodophora sp. 'Broadleaf-Isolate-01']